MQKNVGTSSGFVLVLSESKVGRKKDSLKCLTKYLEFILQSMNGESRVVCFSPQKGGLVLEAAVRYDIEI